MEEAFQQDFLRAKRLNETESESSLVGIMSLGIRGDKPRSEREVTEAALLGLRRTQSPLNLGDITSIRFFELIQKHQHRP